MATRYFIEHSYVGTNYKGWQKQPNAVSIEEHLERALSTILRQKIEIIGSSRTDAGVHATHQMAHFDLEKPLETTEKVVYSCNNILPFDIAVSRIFEVQNHIHARFDATHRCYEYRMINAKNAFLKDLAYLFRPTLNIEAMNEAALLLLKYNDFECFCKLHTDVKTFLCKIEYAYWEELENRLVFKIKANRFLRGMVRAIVGTLIEVGTGKLTKENFEQIILSKNRNNPSAQAPANGLFLTEVGYDFL